MKIKIIYIFLLLGMPVWAQQVVIRASLDSTQIQIGEQTRLHLEIASDKNAQLQLPYIPDTLTTGIEVLEISTPDTTDIDNNRIQIKYDYLITSFDSALYRIPPFKLVAGVDTVYSNDLALKVSTLSVDTETGNFYDIKDIMKPEWVWTDYLPIVLYILGGGILAGLIIYIIIRLKKKQPILPFNKEEVIVLPPHIRALKALEAIKEQKLWQHDKIKEYHSQISDVIRNYIDERFGINAMEMTSGQTLEVIRGVSDVDFVYNNLKQLLLQADLVKFAKYFPLPEENELSMGNACLFVNNTIPVPSVNDSESTQKEVIKIVN